DTVLMMFSKSLFCVIIFMLFNCFFFFFFFSSRRRHTRWPRDWSSDGALPILLPRNVAVAALSGDISWKQRSYFGGTGAGLHHFPERRLAPQAAPHFGTNRRERWHPLACATRLRQTERNQARDRLRGAFVSG